MIYNFGFQAYIPKSCGKPLLSFFQNDRRFRPDILTNYNEFKSKLEYQDSLGGGWIAEPGVGPILSSFFMTDECGFHNAHQPHAYRLRLGGNVDIRQVGNYTNAHRSKIFENNCKQSSSPSHRCVAFITDNHYEKFDPYVYMGIVRKSDEKTSTEEPLDINIHSKALNPSFVPRGSIKLNTNDTTVIEASASAGYPFIMGSPNIDISLKMTITRSFNSDTFQIVFDGEHNLFPAYELLFDNKSIYNYNPSSEGQTGPNPYNLNASKTFKKTLYVNSPFSRIQKGSTLQLR